MHLGTTHRKLNQILLEKGLKQLDIPKTRKQLNSNATSPIDIVKKKSKPTNTLTEEQNFLLIEEFNTNQSLTDERRNALSLALGLTEKQVGDWFHFNRKKLIKVQERIASNQIHK